MNAPSSPSPDVVGRLAPSPTGRLHLGNLSTSLLAWAQARKAGGRVVLRIEDVDGPRVVEGAIDAIIDDLHWLGIDWDEGPDVGGPHAPYVQSARTPHYQAALEKLDAAGLLYACTCSRRDIAEALSAPHGGFESGTEYPGTCARHPGPALRDDVAVRVRVSGVERIHDEIAGDLEHDLRKIPGDFVVRRRDGLFAYQLAVVVDDALMGVADVVRGRDLLDSTPRQAWLHRQLGYHPPRTWHVPMLVNEDGERLSKRTRALARDGLEDAGFTPASLRGTLAHALGLVDRAEDLGADELVAVFDSTRLRAEQVVVAIRGR